MSTKKETTSKENGYLFTIEVLVEAPTNGHALEQLTHLLNSGNFTDYRIVKGVNLGQVIEAAKSLAKPPAAKKEEKPADAKKDEKPADAKKAPAVAAPSLIEQVERYKVERKLVRLSVVKGKGVKLSIPCRILNFDAASNSITVYHVDEKKVYQFRLNEIDELT